MSDLPQKLGRDGLVMTYGDDKSERFTRVESVLEAIEQPDNPNRIPLLAFMGYPAVFVQSPMDAAKARSSQQARRDALKKAADEADRARERLNQKPREREQKPETPKERKQRLVRERQRRYQRRQKASEESEQNLRL